MSYIAFDLDALNRAPAVARAAGTNEETVISGLVRLWAWCFREETDHATTLQIRGLFGLDCSEALAAFGFLEKEGPDWRVRGAGRYLRVKEAQRTAAKRTNQRRAERQQTEGGPSVEQQSTERSSDGPPYGEATPLHRRPNTEHRTPSTDDHERSIDTGGEFFAWAQDERHRVADLPRETPPHPRALSAWSNEALMQVGGDFERLRAGYRRFLESPFWRNEARMKVPWSGWVKNWREFITSTAAPVADPKSARAPAAPSAFAGQSGVTVQEGF